MTSQKIEAKPAIFLDRDGVIIEDVGYPINPSDLKLMKGAAEAIACFQEMGYWVFIISNQSGIARGYFGVDDVKDFNKLLEIELLNKNSKASIDAFFFCPHHPSGSVVEFSIKCHCRKPATGLVKEALANFSVAATGNYFVGDRDSDIACGRAMGFATMQILGSTHHRVDSADFYAQSLLELVDVIRSKE